jgi:hypothetical protein
MTQPLELWITELRSGKYKQGRHRLHFEEDGVASYCCLGVACKLFSEETGRTGESSRQEVSYNHMSTVLPVNVRMKLGLSTSIGSFRHNEETKAIFDSELSSLVELNDIGATFEQIAQIIELRPEGLFENDTSSN